jgi:pyruvate formate lyase activating enzyme
MKIAGYLGTSLIEWPGKITSVIFVPGCNFRCPFCHNADLVDPKKARRLTPIPESEIFENLKKRKKWVDGVVITGGEPTLQPDLDRFLSRLKEEGFLTMIETNGSRPEVLVKLLSSQAVDYVAMDIKSPFEGYPQITNSKVQISEIKESIKLLLASGVNSEFRTTIVPGLHDKEVLLKMAAELKKITEEYKLTVEGCRWFLQTFQPKNCLDPRYKKINPYSKMKMKGFLKAVKKIIPGARIRD